MLDRIMLKFTRDRTDSRSYGARYERAARHASLSRIAEMIRDDIALARFVYSTPTQPGQVALLDPIANAPAEITYSVETPHDSSIVITIDGVPSQWGWIRTDGVHIISPALRALADELADIMKGYNYDGPEIGKRFFGMVRVPSETLSWL
jgi:hypothetical protein